jgi:cysteine desulfurase family protein
MGHMADLPRIYLDNAATSWPKPEAVYRAVDDYQRNLGAPVGRGSYREAIEVEQAVARARAAIARLIGAAEPRRIIFTHNGTAALNLAIQGLLRRGDHVVTTVIEHNSILRPLRRLVDEGTISVTHVPCGHHGIVDPDAIQRAIIPNTRLIAVSHASNVTGAIQPAADIGRLARHRGIAFLVDAAQTAGHLPVDVGLLSADLLAASGHKGLLGPLGTGFLYIGPNIEDRLAPLEQGGTGTSSESDRQPDSLPQKFESGNLNAPGLLGLEAGVRFVQEAGVERLRDHAQALSQRLRAGLEQIPGVRLFGPAEPSQRVGVTSLVLEGYDPQELAVALDAQRRIQARAGLHCAPRMHKALGTLASGGTLRFSVGPFNNETQIDSVVETVRQLSTAGFTKVALS